MYLVPVKLNLQDFFGKEYKKTDFFNFFQYKKS